MTEENLSVVVDDLTPSLWAAKLNISEMVIQEIKLFSQMGWALDSSGKGRQLTAYEQKFLALKCHQSGLSLAAGHMIFLGNKLYVTIGGKRAAAMRDTNKPYFRTALRVATKEERELYGVYNNDPKLPQKFEHLWYAEIYAMISGQEKLVGADYGHACHGNINLKGKDNDTVHLCADMAKTRAQGRALSQAYDFFGLDGYEEVGTLPIAANYEVLPDEPPKSLTERLKEKADSITTVPAQVPPPPPVQEQTESGANPPAPENAGAGPADDDSKAVVDTPTQPSPNNGPAPSPDAADSGTEVALHPTVERPIETLGEVTVQDVLSFIEEHKAVLPPADRKSESALKRYSKSALRITMENLRGRVERATSQTELPSTTEE